MYPGPAITNICDIMFAPVKYDRKEKGTASFIICPRIQKLFRSNKNTNIQSLSVFV